MRTALLWLLFDLLCCLPRPLYTLHPHDSNLSHLLLEDASNATVAEVNVSMLRSKEGSFAEMIDRALEKEFNETEEQSQGFV
ncbi:unnamed protein product [Thlaspi arvense]|uniref:Uncharacterized protein n=1 Tax=Thlaspi arvense TaxID=13288 RepID=A0AAU9S8J4_THLAR|nr:unnamed protein product [Thlaspi arvense]